MLLEVTQAHFGGSDLDVAFVGVGEEFGRAKDRVDHRADEGEDRRGGGAADQEGVGDAAAGIDEREDDQGEPDRDQAEDRESDD